MTVTLDSSLSHHRRTTRRYNGGTPCQLTVTTGGYPYPCVAQDKDPHAEVWVCESHRVWGIVDSSAGCVDTGGE